MLKPPIYLVVKTVEYFWVPAREQEYGNILVQVPKETTRIQTCFRHTDPEVKPDIDVPQHLVNVFYEDWMHDWNWRDGVLAYGSRVSDGGVWIRCEYESPRFTVAHWHEGEALYPRPYKTLAAAKAQVSRHARSYRVFGYRAIDNLTGEAWKCNYKTMALEKVS